jgi:peroxiredoxin
MAQLRRDYQKFIDQNTLIVVVGPEGEEAFRTYFEGHDLPFIGLPDPSFKVLKLFGQEVNLFKLGRMPAQIIIDQSGIARFAHYGKSMSDIPENKELLALLKELNSEHQAELA